MDQISILQGNNIISARNSITDASTLSGKDIHYFAASSSVEALDSSINTLKSIISNENLLDNWDFRNPVNQRGKSSYTEGYTVDRWMISARNRGSSAVNSDHIRLEGLKNANATLYLMELLEKPLLPNTTYTLSAVCRGSRIQISSADRNGLINISNYFDLSDWTLCTCTFTVSDRIPDRVAIATTPSRNADIQCVKLELGSQSTLMNDPPANYGEQLAKCQRYQLQLNPDDADDLLVSAPGSVMNANTVRVTIPLPTTMRIRPTVNLSGRWNIKNKQSSIVGTVTSALVNRTSSTQVILNCTIAETLNSDDIYYLYSDKTVGEERTNRALLLLDANL